MKYFIIIMLIIGCIENLLGVTSVANDLKNIVGWIYSLFLILFFLALIFSCVIFF